MHSFNCCGGCIPCGSYCPCCGRYIPPYARPWRDPWPWVRPYVPYVPAPWPPRPLPRPFWNRSDARRDAALARS
jgi:hypothetical protein